ncbi:MAG: aspartate aminotransferase family protein [Deltaproteobacteria bacterium]|nr:aspartate aminotransferase family protein [Deltaproteobacteria bacterium]
MSTLLPPLSAPPAAGLGTELPAIVTASVPGPAGMALVDLLAAHECPAITARRARRAESTGVDQDPIVWERAIGSNVWDPDGNRFVDLTAGFGVASAGHANTHVVARVTEQLQRHVHGMGDAFPGVARIQLAAALAAHLPGALDQVIFGSDGSDAVEASLKTAVLATSRSRIVACEGSYHGMSLGALGVSHYKDAFRAPFAGLMGRLADWVPFGGDLDAIAEVLDAGEPVAAVLVEPVQGRGGERTAPAAWFQGLAELCRARGALLIFDEIFTGFGRAGPFVQAGTPAMGGVVPDLICLGKGMSSGFPVSACVGTPEVMAAWGQSTGEAIHTSTFLGHPPGCAAALAVLELIDEHGLLERGRALGELMGHTLEDLCARHPEAFSGVRGRGAMRGLEVVGGVERSLVLCRGMLARGFIVLPAGTRGEALSFTPPLTMTAGQWTAALATLEGLL